jgi:acetyltransferase-like isoleucine patch superfamily enzyme
MVSDPLVSIEAEPLDQTIRPKGSYMAIKGKRGVAAARAAQMVQSSYQMIRLTERISGRLRGLAFKLKIMASGGRVGRRPSVGRGVHVSAAHDAKILIGDRVSLGTGVILIVGSKATFDVGNDVYVGHYTLIGAELSIAIGDRALIAEHCSIRDHDHDVSAISMHSASLVCSPVCIGDDSWIARGVAVLEGARIGEGAVIGANAVVRGAIPGNTIAVGVPARVVRTRLRPQ